ncbi:MAG: ABC transporter ATP-binding protein [Planctomycetota bacterium]
MFNLWRAFKLVLPHRGMLVLYLCTALGLALCGGAPLILARTFMNHLDEMGKNAADIEQKQQLRIIQKDYVLTLKPGSTAPETPPNLVKIFDPSTKKEKSKPDVFGIKEQIQSFFKEINDRIQARTGTGRNYIYALCGLIIFFAFLKSVFDAANTYIASWLAQRLRTEAIERVMAKLLTLDMPYFDSHQTGDLVTRMVSDGENLRKTIKIFLDFAQQPFMIVALVSIACYYDWKLFLLGAMGLPLVMLVLIKIVRRVIHQSKRYQEKTADIAQSMLQNLSGIRVIHAYGAEELEAEGFRGLTRSLFRTGMRRNLNRAIQRPLTSFLMGLGGIAVLAWGGARVVANPTNHNISDFLTFIAALAMLYEPVTAIIQTIGEIAEYLPNAERVFQILDVKPTIADMPGATPCKRLDKEITFENLAFDYGRGTVLRDFNLTLRFGEKLGIVGRTGVGKSTLLSLLLRFYDPTAGRISIDGTDIRTVTLATLRSQIALVTQQPFLFNATVAENIRYGRPGATDDEVIAAAKTAMIHDEIMSKPLGYKELCGERGGELFSGGQKQRIAIARALLRNAPILLLDEATSALDSLKERSLQEAFDTLEANRTCLIVAHRLSTLSNADRILVFGDAGGVEAIGTHAELMTSSSTYRTMWQAQNDGASSNSSTTETIPAP